MVLVLFDLIDHGEREIGSGDHRLPALVEQCDVASDPIGAALLAGRVRAVAGSRTDEEPVQALRRPDYRPAVTPSSPARV